MSTDAAEKVTTAIAAIGAGEALPGEGGDRKYEVDGRAWRVRLQVVEQRRPVAPVNGDPDLVPVSFSFGISVALLDESGAVAKDEAGALMVFDQHVVSIDADALGRDVFDPVTAIDYAIASEIAAASSILAKREQLGAALAGWSPSTPAPATPTAPVPAPVPDNSLLGEIVNLRRERDIARAEAEQSAAKLADAEREIETLKAAIETAP